MKHSVLILFLFPVLLYGQDILYFKDGKKTEASIISFDTDTIKYTRYENPNGPVYITYPSQLILITFSGGEYKMYYNSYSEYPHTHHNIISFNTIDFLFLQRISFSFEHIRKNEKMGIRIPVVFGLRGSLLTGTDFLFYTKPQSYFNYFLGPSFRLGLVEDSRIFDDSGFFLAPFFINGIRWSYGKGSIIGIEGAVGANVIERSDFPIRFRFGFNWGYRF
jgi:hypothetical protein